MKATGFDNQLLITIEDAARRLGIGRTTLYQQLRRGMLPSVQVGRCRRIAISDLDGFIDRLRQPAQPTHLMKVISKSKKL